MISLINVFSSLVNYYYCILSFLCVKNSIMYILQYDVRAIVLRNFLWQEKTKKIIARLPIKL